MSEAITIPQRWARFLRALMGLRNGRYQIIVSVWPSGLDYSVTPLGDVHIER